MRFRNWLLLLTVGFFLAACAEQQSDDATTESQPESHPTTGSIERMSDEMNGIIADDAQIEVLADSFIWSEGPVWIGGEDGFVVFSDVPANEAFKWKEGEGLSSYLKPSGYTGPPTEDKAEGSNGLLLDADGNLVLCQHGDRRVARMTAPTDAPVAEFETIVSDYNGQRFSSPNDACFDAAGNLYFTDPPYGLPLGSSDSINREIDFNGVYVYHPDGEVEVIATDLTRPNGIALSPDESTLYVANSDPEAALIMAFDRNEDGDYVNGRVFFDATSLQNDDNQGLPDGLRVLSTGHLMATGPGGVMVITPEGDMIGRVRTGQRTANCEIAQDGYLYMTAHYFLMRVKLIHL